MKAGLSRTWALMPGRGRVVALAMGTNLVPPAGIQLVGIAREGLEGTRKFLMFLGVFDGIGAALPALIGLAQGLGTGRGAVDVAVGAAAGGIDDVAVT